jgi:hypothetical protein
MRLPPGGKIEQRGVVRRNRRSRVGARAASNPASSVIGEIAMNRPERFSRRLRGALILATILAPGCAREDTAGTFAEATDSTRARLERATVPDREWYRYALEPDEGPRENRFGTDVALSGTTAVVGDPRNLAAYVFVLTNDGWQQQEKLVPPTAVAEMTFGGSVAISRDTIVVGAAPPLFTPNAGAAFVYVRSGTTWSSGVPLVPMDGSEADRFGIAVAIDGDTIAVGASTAEGNDREIDIDHGAVYVFERSTSTWPQVGKVVADDGWGFNEFGSAVAISGTTILVGAPNAPVANQQGAAYVYTRSGTSWNNQEKLVLPENLRDSEFGRSVALENDLLVVGAPRDAGPRGPYRAGLAFVYARSSSGWSLRTDFLHAGDAMEHDIFGISVAMSGSSVLVGAPGEAARLLPGADSVYLFDLDASSVPFGRVGTRGRTPFFGNSVDLDGDIGVVGSSDGVSGAFAVELRAPDGSSCDSNLECGSRHCARGVCCNLPCSGACETCASGECTPLPHTSGTPTCSPYLCSEAGGGCPMSCRAHADCTDAHYCRNGRCVDRRSNGATCTEGRECASGQCIDDRCAGTLDIEAECSNAADCRSGHCVDGYCCDQRCDGQCEACDVRGARGVCTAVNGVPHGEREPCESDGTDCGGECDGEHTVSCHYETRSTDCGTSCSGATLTESFCNGLGACVDDDPRPCDDNYACADERACGTTCADTGDCASESTCRQDGSCEPGTTCLDDRTEQKPDGTTRGCAPYLCSGDECVERCESRNDCTPGNACDGRNRCVPLVSRSAASTSTGGCSFARTRSSQTWALWCLAFLVAWAKRRAARARATGPTGYAR